MATTKRRLPKGIGQLPSGAYRGRVSFQGHRYTTAVYDRLEDCVAALAGLRADVRRQDSLDQRANRLAGHFVASLGENERLVIERLVEMLAARGPSAEPEPAPEPPASRPRRRRRSARQAPPPGKPGR